MIKDYLDKILEICCAEFGVSIELVRSNSQALEPMYCRKAYCLIVKELFDIKHELAGKPMNKDNSRVSYYLANQVDNKYYKMTLQHIKNILKTELGEL